MAVKPILQIKTEYSYLVVGLDPVKNSSLNKSSILRDVLKLPYSIEDVDAFNKFEEFYRKFKKREELTIIGLSLLGSKQVIYLNGQPVPDIPKEDVIKNEKQNK